MLDFAASPKVPPSTGQAPEATEPAQTPLETPAEEGAEGFFGLLASNLQPVLEGQEVAAELKEFAGLEGDPELPESGMMLPHNAAAVVLPSPNASVLSQTAGPAGQSPLTQPLVQGAGTEEAALTGLPPKQPLVQAVRSQLNPKPAPRTALEPEHRQPSFSGTAGFDSDPTSGLVRPSAEPGTAKDPLSGVVKGIESMPLLRSSPGGEQPVGPSSALAPGVTGPTASAGEQASTAKMPPVNIPVGEKGWDQSIGERITWMLGNRIQQAEVRLSPPHLGPLEIRVSVHNDQASVSIAAPHVLTREAIEAAIPRLREMMLEGNLNLVNVNVEDRSPGQHNTAGQPGEGSDQASARAQGQETSDKISNPETERPRTATRGLVDDYA